MRIFISHSSHDAGKAAGICSVLEREGHSCFIAPRDIRPGREYAEEIINGIAGADAFLLLLSGQSNQSPHVLREVERAGSTRMPIIVYKLEEVSLTKSLEYFLMTNQWIDGTGDSDYRKAADAFQNMSGSGAELSCDILPAKGEREKGRQSTGKGIALALALCLAVCGIVLVIGRRGFTGNKLADGESQGSGREAMDAGDSAQAAGEVDLSLGTPVEFGAYGGEPILWRVLHASEDGGQLILVSDQILTMKAFDAAESGRYNFDGSRDYWTADMEDPDLEAYVRGSNLWINSNIRAWLNSEKEIVSYGGQAPDAAAMSEKKNGYSNEAGFLHGFSPEEREILREADLFTSGNVLTDATGISCEDRVFLLSEAEMDWFGEADISIYAVPTQNAIEQDKTGWYNGYSLSLGVEEYLWLLRDPAGDSASRCMAVGNGTQSDGCIFVQLEAGAEGFGIRPAVCVDRQALAEFIVSRDTDLR